MDAFGIKWHAKPKPKPIQVKENPFCHINFDHIYFNPDIESYVFDR